MTTGSPAGSSLAFFKVSSPPNNGPRQPKSDLETGTKGTKQIGTIAVELGYRDSARRSRVNETSLRHHGPAGRASNLDEGPPEAPAGQRQIEKLVSVLRSIATANPWLAEKIRTEADYFTLKEMRSGYVIPGFVANSCLLARGRSKPAARLWSALVSNN